MIGRALFALACLLLAPGCWGDLPLETGYGRMRGESVNGTGALAELFRARGHDVRAAVRLTDELGDWADVIVRFAPKPGPPDPDEAAWYASWMASWDGGVLVYVARDSDAEVDYWERVVATMPPDADPKLAKRAEERRKAAANWPGRLPEPAEDAKEVRGWFKLGDKPKATAVASALEGPWSDGVDPKAAALPLHREVEPDAAEAEVLLRGDGRVLAFEWEPRAGGAVLVVANGSFLLNAGLLRPERRKMADRVLDWVDEPGRNVAFVEGGAVLADPRRRSVFDLVRVAPFGWIAAHLLALGLLACLARAPRLGRPKEPPAGEVGRPAAHPEALGALLARAGDAASARKLLEAYRAWRHPAHARPAPPSISGDPPADDPGPKRLSDW